MSTNPNRKRPTEVSASPSTAASGKSSVESSANIEEKGGPLDWGSLAGTVLAVDGTTSARQELTMKLDGSKRWKYSIQARDALHNLWAVEAWGDCSQFAMDWMRSEHVSALVFTELVLMRAFLDSVQEGPGAYRGGYLLGEFPCRTG